MVVKDKTYQMLYDFILDGIKESQVEQYKVILDQWIAARDSIVDVFIETLEVNHQIDYLNHQEKSLIEIFRTLNPDTKQKCLQNLKQAYELECSERRTK